MEGETILEEHHGSLRRALSLVSITVISPHGEHLVEDRQVFMDGRVRRRGLDALAEKFKPGEDPTEAARRALEEELGLSPRVVELLHFSEGSRTEKVEASPSYPGLTSVYRTTHFTVTLPLEAYKSDGYVEHQADKCTYFLWQSGEGSANG